MLKQDLDGENDAIARYIARIRQAEGLHLYHLAQQLRNILAAEQELNKRRILYGCKSKKENGNSNEDKEENK
jgi:bacterioferritin (cytochrome b1)